MIEIREERHADVAVRERLLDQCFGANRHAKTSERLREGRLPAPGLSLAAVRDGTLVGTVRLWHVAAGTRPALLLGPLAVAPELQGTGLGGRLMRDALGRASGLGHGAVLLVGDAPYYARFGFGADRAAGLTLPGPFERARLLGLEIRPGDLEGAAGLVQAAGLPILRSAVPAAAVRPRRRAA